MEEVVRDAKEQQVPNQQEEQEEHAAIAVVQVFNTWEAILTPVPTVEVEVEAGMVEAQEAMVPLPWLEVVEEAGI